MYTISSTNKTAVLNGNAIFARMTVTLADSTTLSITEANYDENSFYIDRASSSNGALPFGACASNELAFTLFNESGTYSNVDFEGASITVEFYTYINGTATKICDGGIYYIINAPKRRKTISIIAYDCLQKCDKASNRAGTGPYNLSLANIVNNVAIQVFGSASAMDTSAVSTLAAQMLYEFKYPSGSDVTYRNIIGWVAMLCGALARSHGNTDLVQIVRAENTGETIGLSNRMMDNFSYDDAITLTGILAYDASENTYTAGTTAYRMCIDNNGVFDMAYNYLTPATTYRQSIVNSLWSNLGSFSYVPCSMHTTPMPWFEAGDKVSFVDDYGVTQTTVITHVKHYLSYSIVESSGMSESTNDIYSSQPSSIKRASIEGEMLCLDALQSLNYAYSSGYYSTAGTYFNLADGTITSKNFAIDSSGNARFKGYVEATGGKIGSLLVDSNGLSFTKGSTLFLTSSYKPSGLRLEDGVSSIVAEANSSGFLELSMAFSNGSATTNSLLMNQYGGTLGGNWTINGYATQQWVTDNFVQQCLIEGTKILMFDGTEKNIEDVKTGDSLMSYNPTTGEAVESIAIDCQCTGNEKDYTTFIFEDGTHCELWGDHSIWRENTKCIVAIKDWQQGNTARKNDGTIVELYSKETVRFPARKNHYVLYSSNNMYFANGILMGHWSSTKYAAIARHAEWNFPADVLAQYETDANANKKNNELLISPEFLSEGTAILRDMRKTETEIAERRKLLDETDYPYTRGFESFVCSLKNALDSEGMISLDAIKTAVNAVGNVNPEQRRTWRNEINAKEPVLAEKKAQYDALRDSIVGEAKSLGQMFRESVTNADRYLESVRSWSNK